MLAAMAPCTRLYGYLGCQLARRQRAAGGGHSGGGGGGGGGLAKHPYAHWIRTYSSPAYLRLPAAKERIIDQLGGSVSYGEAKFPRCRNKSDTVTVAESHHEPQRA